MLELVWSYIKSILLQGIRRFILSIKLKINPHPKWFMPTLQHQLKCIHTFRKRYGYKTPATHIKNRLQLSENQFALECSAAKHCAISLSKPLHYLFSLSLRKHTLPSDWLIHAIVPVYKSGDKTSANNYQPISLLCNISKILEQLICNKVSPHILKCISNRQFGFLRNRSTVQQLLILLNKITNTKNQSDIIHLDIRKVFNSIPRDDLLTKVRLMGISGNLWLWFKSYLSNQQCIKIHNSYSDPLPVLSGIPQGSILGPLTYVSYLC